MTFALAATRQPVEGVQAPPLRLVAALRRVPNTPPGEVQLEILDLDENTRPVRRAFERTYGSAERWRQRSFQIPKKRGEEILGGLREDFGAEAPPFLEDVRTLCEALEEGLQRTGESRPARLSGNLWRIVVSAGGLELPMLVNLRGNWLFNVRRERPQTLQDAREEALQRKARELALISRLWSRDKLDGAPLQRLRQHMNREWLREHPDADPDTERFKFFDTVQAIASHPDLEEDPASPLRRLSVLIDGDTELAFKALFDNSELIDLSLDESEDAGALLRFDVSAAFSQRLARVHETLDSAAEEEIDPAEAELVRVLREHNDIHQFRSSRDLLNSLVQRGGGETVHKDYPDVRRYKVDLDHLDGNGEVVTKSVPVLVRSSQTEVIEEFVLDRVAMRERLLAYHFPGRDRARIARYDRDPRNRVAGHEHGPITHMARLDALSNRPAGAAQDAEPASLKVMDYLAKTATRRTASMVHPAYPEIRMFRTAYRDGALLRPYRFLGRVHQSTLIHVLPEGLDSFLQMTWKKGAPGTALAEVQALLGPAVFHSAQLQALLQPQNMDEDLPDPAYPSWRRFAFADHAVLAKVQDGEIHQIIPDEIPAFDRERRYWLPLRRREHIVEHDKKFGNFLERHRAADQSRMEFVKQHVRHGAGRQIAGWPQLHVIPVPSRTGGPVEMLVRVEDGEIWDALENGDAARKKLQNAILKEHEQHFRRISRAEARRVAQEAVPYVVTRMLARQHARDDDQTRATEQTRIQRGLIERIARRETRAAMAAMDDVLGRQASTYETLAAVDGDVVDLLEALLENDEWQPVPHRKDMRQFSTRVNDDQGEPLRIYAYFNQFEQLVDARIGSEKGLEQLEQTRARNLRALPNVSGSWFSCEEVSEIYLRDHSLRDKKLMELADFNHLTLPELLHRTIPMPRPGNGDEWEFGGEAIRAPDGRSSPYFRRYLVSRGPQDAGAEIHVSFQPILDRAGKIRQMRLADVRLAPPPRHEDFQLSLPLLAQIRYLEQFPASVRLPDLQPQTPLSAPPTPAGSIGAPTAPPTPRPAPGRLRADRQHSPGLFVSDDEGGGRRADTEPAAPDESLLFDAMDMDFTYDDYFNFMDGGLPAMGTANQATNFAAGLAPASDAGFNPGFGAGAGFDDGLNKSRDFGLDSAFNRGLDPWPDAGHDAGFDPFLDIDLGAGTETRLAANPATAPADSFDDFPSLDGLRPEQIDALLAANFDAQLLADFDVQFAAASAAGLLPEAGMEFLPDEGNALPPPPATGLATGVGGGQDAGVSMELDGPGRPVSAGGLNDWLNGTVEPAQLHLPAPGGNAGWPGAGGAAGVNAGAGEVASDLADKQAEGTAGGAAAQGAMTPAQAMPDGSHAFNTRPLAGSAAGSPGGRAASLSGVSPRLQDPGRQQAQEPGATLSAEQAGQVPTPSENMPFDFDDPTRIAADADADAFADFDALANPFIFRVELPPAPVLEEFLPSLKKNHGREIYQSVTDWLFPDGDSTRFEERVLDWARLMTAPHLESEPVKNAPGLVRFTTPVLDKDGVPLNILGWRKDGKLIAPWPDTRKNRSWISAEIKKEYPQQESLPRRRRKTETGTQLSAVQARNMASSLDLPQQQLDGLAQYLLDDPEREAVLDAIFRDAGVTPGQIGETHEILRRFVIDGVAKALEGRDPARRRLKIPTGVQRGNRALELHLTLAAGHITHLWIPQARTGAAARQSKLEKNEPDEELGLRYMAPVKTEAREHKLKFMLAPGAEKTSVASTATPRLQTGAARPEQAAADEAWLAASPARRSGTKRKRETPASEPQRKLRRPGTGGRDLMRRAVRQKNPPGEDQAGHDSQDADAMELDPVVPAAPSPSVPAGLKSAPPPVAEARPSPAVPAPATTALATAAPSGAIVTGNRQAAAVLTRQQLLSRTRSANAQLARAPAQLAQQGAAAAQVGAGRTQAFLVKAALEKQKALRNGLARAPQIAPIRPLPQAAAVMGALRAAPAGDGVAVPQTPGSGDEEFHATLAARSAQVLARAPYRFNRAKGHWSGRRAADFGPHHAAWNAAQIRSGRQGSGVAFLMHLSRLCERQNQLKAGRAVDGGGRITEFEIVPHQGAAPLRVWKLVESNGVVDLMLAPPQDDPQARRQLEQAMLDNARASASRRLPLAGEISYPSKAAEAHWSGVRADEFGPTLERWAEAENVTLSGSALLRHLSAQCDAVAGQGGGTAVDDQGQILEFTVATSRFAPALTVWRKVDDGGGDAGMINLRLAPPAADATAREALRKNMASVSARSASSRMGGKPTATPYTLRAAETHWQGARAAEFQPMLDDWNEADLERGIRHSGTALLVHVAGLCQQESARGNAGVPVDEDGRITEFSVATHEGGPLFRVWRMLTEGESLALRMAPPGRSKKARQALIDSMIAADGKRRVWKAKREKSQAPENFFYDPRTAKAHWAGGRKNAMAGKLDELNRHRRAGGAAGQEPLSGAKFLLHLHALCNQADADNLGAPVDEEERIFEFSIRLHEDLDAFTVWRMVGDSVNLQVAPAPEDSVQRKALQKKMLSAAQGAATAKTEKLPSQHGIDYPSKAARAHWTKHRINDFDAIRKESNRKDRVERTGAQFLIYLSQLCDIEDAKGVGEIISGEKFKQFTLRTHTGAQPIQVMRLAEGPGLISLRLAPPQPKAREELVASMLKTARNSVSRMQAKLDDSEGLTLRRWGGPRARALEPVLKDWIRSAGTAMSGTGLLEYLENECRRLSRAGQARAVDEEGQIEEFRIVAPADASKPQAEEVDMLTIWRLVNSSKSVDLRLLTEPDDDAARQRLKAEMAHGAEMASSKAALTRRQEEQGTATVTRLAKQAWQSSRLEDFDLLRREANRIEKLERSGAQFLIHLVELCNAELQAGRGEAVDEEGEVTEFALRLWEKGALFHVWYVTSRPDGYNLRLAPAADDEAGRQVRLAGMLNGGRYARLDRQTAEKLSAEVSRKLGRQ